MSQLPFFKHDDFFTSPVRLLVRESHAIFASIPRGEDNNRTNIVAISRRYRSIVHECIENLQAQRSSSANSSQIKTFKELEVVWNLCEILLLDVNQTATLIIQLGNWIKMHFNELPSESRDILNKLDASSYRLNQNDSQDSYWNLFTLLVLRGETKKAIQLLSCHHDFQRNDQMQLVASMLDTMPLSNQYIVHEFANKWATWSSWCKRELMTGQFESNPHLLNIVRLLSQDPTVYADLAPRCDTWYHLMVAHLMYTDPCIKDTDLADLCRKTISIYKQNNSKYSYLPPEPSQFDEIIISAFEYDLISVVANCCAYMDDNWWFVTHFIDLLHSCDQLKMHQISDCDKLRETFLQDYAATLFDDNLLWPVGVSYLDSCPTHGKYYLEILLTQLPLTVDDEDKANKICSIAKKRNLDNTIKSVCLVMARNWLKQAKRLGDSSLGLGDKQFRTSQKDKLPAAINLSNALYWAIKSGDTSMMTFISDQYLYYYRISKTFPDKSVLESLCHLQMDNERLAFLTKYFEFQEILLESRKESITEAGELIQALLASKVYPKFFCTELLTDARNLLDLKHQLTLRPDNTLNLMRSVKEVTKDGSDLEGGIDLRKNLVRSMARSIIFPSGAES